MRISAIKLTKSKEGLDPFYVSPLGRVVILSGSNGSGKTRLLKLLEQYVSAVQNGEDESYLNLKICRQREEDSEIFCQSNANQIKLVNYSHFDAQLQLPENFTPYVISKAKEVLEVCNYEETALNSLLLLDDMAHGYSSEFRDGVQFKDFVDKFAKPFHIQIKKDQKNDLRFFCDLAPDQAALSPGQRYLLRIAVACYRNIDNEKLIFILDEPELHLHPQAQIEMVKTLCRKFPQAQFWISTHSLALISYLTVAEDSTTVLHIREGKVSILRSDSESLLEGLIGSEENRFAINQLMAAPDEYACNKFAVECKDKAGVLDATGNDPQAELVRLMIKDGDTIVDYGAGKGRLLEELALVGGEDFVKKIHYYAYDCSDEYADECRKVIQRYEVPINHYYNDESVLKNVVSGNADYVLLVNVLHEIEPKFWKGVFDTAAHLLKEGGELVIVEREELTIGEAPYKNGFLMITCNGADKLFGINKYVYEQHDKKKYIIKYRIKKKKIKVTEGKVIKCVKEIKKDAFDKIAEIKHGKEASSLAKYKAGLSLAFYLNQYANASLILDDFNAQKTSLYANVSKENN